MDRERLRRVFDRTMGRCHICGSGLSFSKYGTIKRQGPQAWEIEHSTPRSRGGTERLNNLYAAHVRCNRLKGVRSSRSARLRNGLGRSPMSETERERTRGSRMAGGAVLGGIAGARLGGPPGAVVGALLGAIAGSGDPEED